MCPGSVLNEQMLSRKGVTVVEHWSQIAAKDIQACLVVNGNEIFRVVSDDLPAEVDYRLVESTKAMINRTAADIDKAVILCRQSVLDAAATKIDGAVIVGTKSASADKCSRRKIDGRGLISLQPPACTAVEIKDTAVVGVQSGKIGSRAKSDRRAGAVSTCRQIISVGIADGGAIQNEIVNNCVVWKKGGLSIRMGRQSE